MTRKAHPKRFYMYLFGPSGCSSFLRFGCMITAMSVLQPNFVFAHPGHDHHAPQTGFMHWLLAPTHAIPIFACLGLAVGLAIWKLRSVASKSTMLNSDSAH